MNAPEPKPYTHPFLAGTRQLEAHCSAGRCDLPILYEDASQMLALYRVALDAAAALIPDQRLEPMPVFGKAVAGIAAFEYRDNTAGKYNEIGLVVLARRRQTRPSLLRLLRKPATEPDAAFYVVNLPVTTELARAAGAEFWGYPKYVTAIETNFTGNGVRFTLAGEFALNYRKGPGLSLAAFPVTTFSIKHGQLLRTVIPTHGRMRFGGAGSVELDLLGDGPTARSVRALGLQHLKPFAISRNDALRVILPAGEQVR